MATKDTTVILGAGLAGLSAAYHLGKQGKPYLCFERLSRPGGLVRSEKVGGYTFDYTGHLLHLARPETRKLVLQELALEGRFHQVARRSFIYSHGVYTRYPFQANTFGLPPSVIQECLQGFIEARIAEARKKPVQSSNFKVESFEDWIVRTSGEGIAKHFMRPYNTKIWGVPPSEMTTEWMGRFVPQPSLEQVLRGALSDQPLGTGYNANFLYPKKGGIEMLAAAFSSRVQLQTGLEALSIDPKRRQVRLSGGRSADYGRLITTLPLKKLVGLISGVPARVTRAAARLRAANVFNVNLGVAGRVISDKQWVYVPEPAFPFYRVGFPHAISPAMAPAGCSSLYAEVSYSEERPLDKVRAPARVIRGLKDMGILRASDRIAARFIADIPNAYVIYDRHRTAAVKEIQAYLSENRIISTGRWGAWVYGSMEDAIWQGAEAAGVKVG